MEYLNRCLGKLKNKPDFNFHPKCEKLNLINISFADNLILFSRGDSTSVNILMEEFKQFSEATGLKAHSAKCKLYFGGVHQTTQDDIMQNTGFSKGDLPFKYLGVPLDSRKISVLNCRPLINRIVGKIAHWTSKLLSYEVDCNS
ncbi:unnamed protein product [Lathyrus sativus]|nr:unnamed protein product [Lathyrus sativus]